MLSFLLRARGRIEWAEDRLVSRLKNSQGAVLLRTIRVRVEQLREHDKGPPMLKHNSYFEGMVQSIGFERRGRAQSVGVVEAGEHRFSTAAAERMTVVSGEFEVRFSRQEAWQVYSAGTYFEIDANSAFEIRVATPAAYLCEYF